MESAPEDTARLDDLVRHTRHLNVAGISGPALSVLSPETQERIRRLQTQGQIQSLRLKDAQSGEQLRKLKQQRQKVSYMNIIYILFV